MKSEKMRNSQLQRSRLAAPRIFNGSTIHSSRVAVAYIRYAVRGHDDAIEYAGELVIR